MKVRILIFLSVLSLILFIGCSNDVDKVAILKFVTHPALDELEDGFTTTLEAAIKSESQLKGFKIDHYNANKSPQTAKELSEVISHSNVKLILAIATPAAQAVYRTPSEIPLLYGAVANPQGAGIIPSQRATGIQNAGYSIIEQAILFIKKSFPKATIIGTLYNPAEQNSVYVQKLMKKSCEKLGFKLIQRPVSDPTIVSSMTQDLCKEVDIIYSANDNTVNSNVASVVAVCASERIPFILGDLSTLSKGAFASVGLEYKSMGESLAKTAIEILKGKSIKDFPPQDPPAPEIWVNKDTFEKFNLTLPDAGKAMVDKWI